MGLKTLKLELLERIALIDDGARLLNIKRMLDAPRNYGIPNEQLTIVSSVRLIIEQYQLIAEVEVSGCVGISRKGLLNGHFLEEGKGQDL